jgi:hypothetical protein
MAAATRALTEIGTPWQGGSFCPDFHVTYVGGHMAYAIWIKLPAVPSGAIVVQKTADLNEHEVLLNSVSYPMEPREGHIEEYRRRTNFPPGGFTTNLSWRSVLPNQPWLINILTDNHTEALCLLAGELVFLGEQLSQHRIRNQQPANTLFRATIARVVFHQFYARSMLREQFEVTQSTAAPVLKREE